MAQNLVVVESPAKCRTIKKFLGPNYRVEASMGHIMDLPTKQLGVDINDNFAPHYVLIRRKANVVAQLREIAQQSDHIYLATDPDREGEAIAWHLAQEIANEKKATARITFNEITQEAIQAALQHPHSIDMNLVNAQQARRVLDRLVGYRVSPILWKTIHGRLSAGRVQSVALRMVCEREVEIEKFQPQEYWTITAKLVNPQGQEFEAELVKIRGKKAAVDNGDQAAALKQEIEAAGQLIITHTEKKKTKRHPRPPFITSTLQQDASRKLNFSAKKTMMLAQQLYEGVEIGTEGPTGLITYMRTDSTRIAEEAQNSARAYATTVLGQQYVPEKNRVYRSKKGAQDAHEAIRPTVVDRSPKAVRQYLTKDQARLYELIWKRFLASQMASAVYDQTKAEVTAGELVLQATGSVQIFDGYLKVYSEQEGNGKEKIKELPELNQDDRVTLQEVSPKQHFTQPPPRYTEASLVRELEIKGVGRPSTYAQIISTNLERKYIKSVEKKFQPTELGKVTNELLFQHFEDVFNAGFTAALEEKLDQVEDGIAEWVAIVRDFYGPFEKQVAAVNENKASIKKQLQEGTGEKCEKCGEEMIIKWGRNGRFIACSGYPKCKNTKPLNHKEQPAPEKSDEKCPTCGAPMVIKKGRFGRFLACTTFPQCKTTKPLGLGVACPEKGCNGEVVERHSKRGRSFYSCGNYPTCTFVSWNKPVNQACEHCDSTFLVEKWSKGSGTYRFCLKCKAKYQTEDEPTK